MRGRLLTAAAIALAALAVPVSAVRAGFVGPSIVDAPLMSSIASGDAHTCVLRGSDVWCSGSSAYGQLGVAGITRAINFEPSQMRSAVAVSAGGNTTCAIGIDRSLWCWGLLPVATDPATPGLLRWEPMSTPTGVPLGDVASVAVSARHICAFTSAGFVWCWGDNDQGQLGTGDTIASPVPVRTHVKKATAIDTGARHSCAIVRDTSVWCWGSNQFHQSGVRSVKPVLTPARTKAPASTSIALGDEFSCTVGVDTRVRCWGRNNTAQLGSPSGKSRIAPIAVRGHGYRTLSAGGRFSCATRSSGTTWCWGNNESGQLANGGTTSKWYPQKVVPQTNVGTVTSVSAGSQHACATTSLVGAMWCWGNNASGQLGDSSTVPRRGGTAVWAHGVRLQRIGTDASARVVIAGDISCNFSRRVSAGEGPLGPECGDAWTADLTETLAPDAFIALGDIQYEDASIADFTTFFDPTWKLLQSRTYPVRGNHEYITPGAAGYVQYFAGLSAGYWSADMGGWRLIAVDSWCLGQLYAGCSAVSPQATWLAAQLDAAQAEGRCAAVVMHHPPYSSGRLGTATAVPFWKTAVEHGADLMVTAHDHLYERFARLGSDGQPSADGLPLFISGLGGAQSTPFSATPMAGSEFRQNDVHGVTEFTFSPGAFTWRFVSAQDSSTLDSGSGTCR